MHQQKENSNKLCTTLDHLQNTKLEFFILWKKEATIDAI